MGWSARGELLRCLLQRLSLVSEFPSNLWIVDLAEVTVVGGLGVDRAEEVELLDDVGRLEGEDLQDGVEDLVVADRAGAEGVDVDAHRLWMADGVGELNFAAGGEAGGHDVLRNPAAHVGGAAVHFGRVFAREGTTAVTAHAAVAIDDDLAPGEAAVALWATDDELAGRIDEILGVLGEHVLRQHLLNDLLDAEFFDLGVSHICRVLRGDDDVHDARRLVVHVFDGDLALRVWAQPLGQLARLADAGQLTAKAVGKHDRRRHELRRVVTGEAKHDALVTRTLFLMFFAFSTRGVHALGDVGALDGKVVVDEDFVGVEHVVIIGVTNAAHSVTDDFADVDDFIDGLGGAVLFILKLRDGDLTTDDDDIALGKGLAGDAALRIDRKAGVEDGVRNGVANFVRMAFADGLGREDVATGHNGVRVVYMDES
jgi:hypothetical protein